MVVLETGVAVIFVAGVVGLALFFGGTLIYHVWRRLERRLLEDDKWEAEAQERFRK